MRSRSALCFLLTFLMLLAELGGLHLRALADVPPSEVVGPTISLAHPGTSYQYFTVNATKTITWSCTLRGGTDYNPEYFYIYDPSGKQIVSRSAASTSTVSHSGTIYVQPTQMGNWKAQIAGGGSGQATVTYPYLTPPVVTQVSPLTGATVSTPSPEARWTFADPDGHYQDNAEVQFSRDSAFGTGSLTSSVTTTATVAVPPYALGDGVWYWRVRCQCSDRVWSPWSPAQRFTVAVGQPVIPGLLTVSEAGTGTLKISWPAAVNTPVSGYYLDIGTTPQGAELTSLTVAGTSATVSVPSDLILYATVRAIGPGSNPGPRSNPADLRNLQFHLATSASSLTGYITLTQPGDFTWSGSATERVGTETYRGSMQMLDPAGVVQVSMVGPATVTRGYEFVSSTQLGQWTVKLTNTRSGSTSVTVDVQYTRNLAPTLKNMQVDGAVADGAMVSNTVPLFQWQFRDPEWANMGEAKFTFSKDQSFAGTSTFTTQTSDGTSLIPSQPLTEGLWYWKSQASDEWGMWSPWSPVRTLTVDLTKPTIPANVQVTQSPSGERLVTWNASTDPVGHGVSSGLKGYYVYAGSQPGLFDLLNGEFVTGTTLTLPTTSYVPYCMVRATDNAGNLSEATSDRTVRTSWDYDEVGNRTSQIRNKAITLYDYNDLNQLTELIVFSGFFQWGQTVTFEYDANGNQIRKIDQTPEGTETWEYTYDDLNRLTSIAKGGVVLAAYAYDAFGRRVKAAQNGQLTVFMYSDLNVIYEETYDAPGDPLTALDIDLSTRSPVSTVDYVRGNGQLVAKLVPGIDPAGQLSGEVANYYHLDHLGSVRVMTDSLGNTVSRMDYEPFGAYLASSSGGEHFGFTGQRNEDTPETAATSQLGLYYYGARFYDPAVGRFITQDPIGDGLNWYTYCGNSPIVFVDPTGMKLAVGSSKDDEDDTVEGQHVWTGNPTYDVDHAAANTAIDKGTDEAYMEYFQYQDVVYDKYRPGESRDITRVFEAWLARNAAIASRISFQKWLARVWTGGLWDIKSWPGVLRGEEHAFRHFYLVRDQLLRPDDLGNINYGYTGHARGMSMEVLLIGSVGAGGLGEVKRREFGLFLTGHWDDPKDHFFIEFGWMIFH